MNADGKELGLQQFCLDTDIEESQVFNEILTELNQMEALSIDDGIQPKQEFLQVMRHLCLLEGFHVDFTRTRENASTIC